jgi:hypothetical protein
MDCAVITPFREGRNEDAKDDNQDHFVAAIADGLRLDSGAGWHRRYSAVPARMLRRNTGFQARSIG